MVSVCLDRCVVIAKSQREKHVHSKIVVVELTSVVNAGYARSGMVVVHFKSTTALSFFFSLADFFFFLFLFLFLPQLFLSTILILHYSSCPTIPTLVLIKPGLYITM